MGIIVSLKDDDGSVSYLKARRKICDEMGVNLDIISLLNDPTIKNIANEIENNDVLDLKGVIESSRDMVYYPLTENQMGIYYECIQSGDVAQYNLPSVIRFGSEIDADRLRDAIIKTIETYPYLKTRIVAQEGKVMLKRDDSIDIDDIPIVDVEGISDEEIEKENVKLFDLHNDQLFRFKIYKTPGETILFSALSVNCPCGKPMKSNKSLRHLIRALCAAMTLSLHSSISKVIVSNSLVRHSGLPPGSAI